jgi:hypothetical protein
MVAHSLMHRIEIGSCDESFGHATLIARDHHPKPGLIEQGDGSRHSWENVHLFPAGHVFTRLRFPVDDPVTV